MIVDLAPFCVPNACRLLILLALLIGVLYCIHLLVKDYQAVTSAGRLLSFLFKRDTSSSNFTRPHVRWRKILRHDPIQCARYLYCDIGARPTDNEIRRGFSLMLRLEPQEEDVSSHAVFLKAYELGRQSGTQKCKADFSTCPFDAHMLFQLVEYLLGNGNVPHMPSN